MAIAEEAFVWMAEREPSLAFGSRLLCQRLSLQRGAKPCSGVPCESCERQDFATNMQLPPSYIESFVKLADDNADTMVSFNDFITTIRAREMALNHACQVARLPPTPPMAVLTAHVRHLCRETWENPCEFTLAAATRAVEKNPSSLNKCVGVGSGWTRKWIYLSHLALHVSYQSSLRHH
jgi:hypothetical protein